MFVKGMSFLGDDWPKKLKEECTIEYISREKELLDTHFPLPDSPLPMTPENLTLALELCEDNESSVIWPEEAHVLIRSQLDKEKFSKILAIRRALRNEIQEKYDRLFRSSNQGGPSLDPFN